MHVLLVADGRSPTTRRWSQALFSLGHSVSLVSTFPCPPLPGLQHFQVIPVAFSRLAASPGGFQGEANSGPPRRSLLRQVVARFRPLFQGGRYVLGPLSVVGSAGRLRQAVSRIQPDLVHALRIPFEGMLASYTSPETPLVVSTWGNDLTLHARGSPWMGALTRRCLKRTQGLISDTRRDLRLGREWGLPAAVPTLVVPGSGGINLDEIQARGGDVRDLVGADLADRTPLVINPRGIRPGSVRTGVFFQALPLLLERLPETLVVCPALAGQPEVAPWMEQLRSAGLERRVRLLPTIPQPRLWDLFHRAQVFVSPSAHDGTPNSLLEAMACGCFPVAGDIESLREWITPGENGLLVDPGDAQALADAICLALSDPQLRSRAAALNAEIIARRVEAGAVQRQIDAFYRSIHTQQTTRSGS